MLLTLSVNAVATEQMPEPEASEVALALEPGLELPLEDELVSDPKLLDELELELEDEDELDVVSARAEITVPATTFTAKKTASAGNKEIRINFFIRFYKVFVISTF
jgi:hypothetical protein